MEPEIWRQHRARGQDQQRQSRFCLGTRIYRWSQQALFKQEGEIGAGNETRTRDFHLGKVVLYQLSYSRVSGVRR